MSGNLHRYLQRASQRVTLQLKTEMDAQPKAILGYVFTNFGNKLSQDMLPTMEANCVFQKQKVETRHQLDLTEIVYHLLDLSEKF